MEVGIKLADVEELLERHSEVLVKVVEHLKSVRDILVKADLDNLIEAKGDDEDQEGDNQQRDQQEQGKQRRGFAAMDPEKRSEIARKGGEASHGGQGQSRGSREEQLEAMEQFLEERGGQLNAQGRKEVENAIEQKRGELETQH